MTRYYETGYWRVLSHSDFWPEYEALRTPSRMEAEALARWLREDCHEEARVEAETAADTLKEDRP
jgi:hypothetical protein